jgi:hypothetical protein
LLMGASLDVILRYRRILKTREPLNKGSVPGKRDHRNYRQHWVGSTMEGLLNRGHPAATYLDP